MPQQVSVPPDQEQSFGDLLRQDGYTTTKARSAQDDARCPNCGSGNYLAGQNEEMRSQKRCFDCGHNNRFEQTSSGISTANAGPPRPARVQNAATNFPQAGTVMGHA